MREDLRPIILNIIVSNEHVCAIEQSTRTIKDCTQFQIHNLPYSKYPKAMIIGCAIFVMRALNNKSEMSKV